MSRLLSSAALSALLVSAACTTTVVKEAAPTADDVASQPKQDTCACAGIAVDQGTVDAACGASVCVGGAGYRCGTDGLSVSPDPAACPHNWSEGTGGFTGLFEETLDDGGSARLYAINVPDDYSGEVGVPLVLHFHGWRPGPADVKDEIQYLWKPSATANGFITVAPEGGECPELNPNGTPFLCFREQRDDAWLKKLIADIESKYNIDRDRIYLSGHSGGGFFVQGYALLNANKFHAAVTFASGCISSSDQYGNSCSVYRDLAADVTRKIPFFIAHHPDDKVVSSRYSESMRDVLTGAGFPVQTRFGNYSSGSNGHSIDPKIVPEVWTWLSTSDDAFVAPTP